ncbi:50S ribosomal protein L32 [Candidatus Uhrbacteria bacterium RIFOXYB12_FULL_58_10]|uniref:Large ribosomal subunit protein bL32 n=1 Tax=Candidatus Uhrbacteria bacterium RIFOXYB2_FULL_57_15 TaxID=1802422 RepID=A0A1F7W8T2_9BACT|nr:MAG: 50S ribosomal protein L32 [Candidatus Uhrbacteria bacterium RIFOXYB12_FULL_58_10]OGL98798.1 MAG: 50S ribosomal protein L32 [Candidatus Uhrbacteria bacterium RIFOXYB2_FULL_57_15]OGL99791.1 MAG: 50S ribosomal protein L32 [Candidatus Uhrbacteria bacterium RIFOXYC12_FULL_57_11]
MGLPGHRRTSSHKRRRASHFALAKTSATECQKCKAPVLPHRACKICGFYRGRTVVDTARAAARLVKRLTAKKPPVPPQEHDHEHKNEKKA